MSAYFAFYSEQCDLFLHDEGQHAAVRTHEELARIVDGIRANNDREELIQIVQAGFNRAPHPFEGEILARSVDLAARLFLMVDFGEVPNSLTDGTRVDWSYGTVQQCLRQHFSIEPILECGGVKLSKVFNARNLVRIGGLKLRWTNNLADHLRVIDDDQTVEIFSHAAFLKLHLDSGIFPDGLIEETLRTLSLFFPTSDKAIMNWAGKMKDSFLDKQVCGCGNLRAEMRHIEKFWFWRDRLVVLKEVFDDTEPSTLSQWWLDRRKRVQWYTFWLAALVLVLGTLFAVIQCVLGALQASEAWTSKQGHA